MREVCEGPDGKEFSPVETPDTLLNYEPESFQSNFLGGLLLTFGRPRETTTNLFCIASWVKRPRRLLLPALLILVQCSTRFLFSWNGLGNNFVGPGSNFSMNKDNDKIKTKTTTTPTYTTIYFLLKLFSPIINKRSVFWGALLHLWDKWRQQLKIESWIFSFWQGKGFS